MDKQKQFLRPVIESQNNDDDYDEWGERPPTLVRLNGLDVHLIDNIETIITSIKNDVAKGYILDNDLTLDPCFIVRNDYCFSHGRTLKEALEFLESKTNQRLPVEQRIVNFRVKFTSKKRKYRAMLFYEWHFKLTGSCKMGRDSFVKNKGIDLSKDKFTVDEFIALTINEYGGNVIAMLVNK